MTENDSRELLSQLAADQSRAAEKIHGRYVRRLIALAQVRIAPRLAPRIDAEDIVQSAYRSFFVRARQGAFQLDRSGDLWRLLAQITINKLRRQVERHSAARRAYQSERPLTESWGEDRTPSPEDVVVATDLLEHIMQQLTPLQREILQRRLTGESHKEIASSVDRSQRTVRRQLELIRRQIELG